MKKARLIRHSFILFIGAFLVISYVLSSCNQKKIKQAKSGSEMYVAYCEICHGATGKGNGAMASMLKMGVPDLTDIALRNNGKFDSKEIYSVIDGTKKLDGGHGSEMDMPIWSVVFANSEDIDRDLIPEKIEELVAFLKAFKENKFLFILKLQNKEQYSINILRNVYFRLCANVINEKNY